MPDCSSQEAALNLAQAEEAVAYAEMVVETAEATLATMLHVLAQGNTTTAMMAWYWCMYGAGGGMAMAKEAAPERPEITVQRDAIKRFKAIEQQTKRQRDDLKERVF